MNIIVPVFLFYKLWIPARGYHDLILFKGASHRNSTATFFFTLIPSCVLGLWMTSAHEQCKCLDPNNTWRTGFLFLRRPTSWCLSWARGGARGLHPGTAAHHSGVGSYQYFYCVRFGASALTPAPRCTVHITRWIIVHITTWRSVTAPSGEVAKCAPTPLCAKSVRLSFVWGKLCSGDCQWVRSGKVIFSVSCDKHRFMGHYFNNDDDCFYYHSWKNNVVIAFGTLTSFHT